MKTTSQKTFEKIESDHLKPIAGWHFLLKNSVILVGAIAAGIIGSLAMAIIFHAFFDRDWPALRSVGLPATDRLLMDIPYLWLIITVLMIVLAYYNVKHSKSGYRYSPYIIAFGSILFSIVFGAICYYLGVGHALDNTLDRNIPGYPSVEDRRSFNWERPEKGLLGGEVVEENESTITLRDFQGKLWQIDTSGAKFINTEKSLLHQKLRIIGEKTGEKTFSAKEIRLWESIKGIFRKPPPPPISR